MKESVADAFRAKVEGGQIVIEFGQGAGDTVSLSDRIVLPSATAGRLVLALGECLRQHGPALRAGAAPPTAAEAAELLIRGQTPVNAPADEAGEKAALLLRLVGELGVPYQYERSFRLSEGLLQANRFLLTVDRRDLGGDSLERVTSICRRLEMPPAALAAAGRDFDIARFVHFGFESGAESMICKLYLERGIAPEEAQRAKARAEGILQHLAFKWDVREGTHVVTRYLWRPALSGQGIEERLAHIYRGPGAEFSIAAAKAVLHLAASKTPAERLQYLEVLEDENDRRSFDLNLYAADMQVKDLQSVLYRMRDHYRVRPGQFQALYDQVRTKALGHLAGGVHRNGSDFFNVYYGVAGWPRFAQFG
jgi:tryptophan 7-halogenase